MENFNSILFSNDTDILNKINEGAVFHHFSKGDFWRPGQIAKLIQLHEDCQGGPQQKVLILSVMKIQVRGEKIYLPDFNEFAPAGLIYRFINYSCFTKDEFWKYFQDNSENGLYNGQVLIWGNISKVN